MDKRNLIVYEFGPFQVDPAQRLLLRNGRVVPVATKVFDTLLLLVEHHGQVLAKEEMIERLWPDTFVEEGNLAKNVSRLRQLFADVNDESEYIETLPKRGYRFIAKVLVLANPRADPSVGGPTSESRDQRNPDERSTPQSDGPVPVVSIAVLPFRTLGSQEEDQFLGLGLADALITQLGGMRRLIVRPTSSVLRYSEGHHAPADVGHDLRVNAVLEGSVQRTGDRVRVTAQLVGVLDDAPLWAGKFDSVFTDIFALQDSIAERVAGALALELSGEERALLVKHHTANTEAYEHFLKGRYFWNLVRSDSLAHAIHHFAEAARLDPNYAPAYAWLADSFSRLSISSDEPSRNAFPLAKEAVLRALVIDDRIADPHSVLGWISFWYDWDWRASELSHQRAIAIDPNSSETHFGYAHLLSNVGRHSEARQHIDRSLALDPVSLIKNSLKGLFLFQARQYDQAIEHMNMVLDLEPGFWVAQFIYGINCERVGRYEEALDAFAKSRSLSEGSTKALSLSGYTAAVSGREDQARQSLGELGAIAGRTYVPPYNIALVHHGLRETPQAIALLERAYEERDVHMVFLGTDSKWDTLRGTTAFDRLLEKMNFPS